MKQHRNKYEYKSWANRERASQGQGPEEGVGGGDLARSDLGRYVDEYLLYCLSTLSSGVLLNVLYLVIRSFLRLRLKAGHRAAAAQGQKKKKRIMSGRPRGEGGEEEEGCMGSRYE